MKPQPTPATERTAALRARREAAGLKRLDLYVHPADHERVKAFADKLTRARQRSQSPTPRD